MQIVIKSINIISIKRYCAFYWY